MHALKRIYNTLHRILNIFTMSFYLLSIIELLTSLTIPVTFTPLEANTSKVRTSSSKAALPIIYFSTYSNITTVVTMTLTGFTRSTIIIIINNLDILKYKIFLNSRVQAFVCNSPQLGSYTIHFNGMNGNI